MQLPKFLFIYTSPYCKIVITPPTLMGFSNNYKTQNITISKKKRDRTKDKKENGGVHNLTKPHFTLVAMLDIEMVMNEAASHG